MPTGRLNRSRLRTAREQAGLSQDAAAAAIGVSKATIQNWESGRRTRVRAADLSAAAAAYQTTVEYLLEADPDEGSSPTSPAEAERPAAPDDRYPTDAQWEAMTLAEQVAHLRSEGVPEELVEQYQRDARLLAAAALRRRGAQRAGGDAA